MIARDVGARVLELLCYENDSEIEDYLEGFTARYGELSFDAAVGALRHNDSFDRLFAIFLLGMSDDPMQRAQVGPFLASDDPWEQWPSALCLGVARDAAVFPLICKLLTAQWPTSPDYREAGAGYVKVWRPYLARLLGEWGRREAVVPLRQALLATLELSDEIWDDHDLAEFTDEVVFALGRLQAIGALTAIQATPTQLDQWRIHLCVGSLFGHYPMPEHSLRPQGKSSEAIQALWMALKEQWGLTIEQAHDSLRRYQGWKVEARYHSEFIERRGMLDLSWPSGLP